ncbi:MAG: DUF559 domain-containing protein [Methanosarcina thermophila]
MYDFERDNYLKNLGNKILRFENKLIFENLEDVLVQVAVSFAS